MIKLKIYVTNDDGKKSVASTRETETREEAKERADVL